MSAAYTADQLETGVANALAAHDMEAAVDILKALFAVDFDRGVKVYETLQDGITTARTLDRLGVKR